MYFASEKFATKLITRFEPILLALMKISQIGSTMFTILSVFHFGIKPLELAQVVRLDYIRCSIYFNVIILIIKQTLYRSYYVSYMFSLSKVRV